MATSQNFLTGRMRKSAGGARFSTWRGLNIVASKPMVVRQNVTPAVQLNRNKMSLIGKLVSRLNPYVDLFYSLGISKTTPFADTVKFFRNRLKDDLKLDASLLAGASFGTGNTPTPSYAIIGTSIDNLIVHPSNVSPLWGSDDITVHITVINEDCTKVYYTFYEVSPQGDIPVDLIDSGFVIGDKIAVCIKPVKTRPGTDLSGSVKFTSNTAFTTLTA